MFLPSSPPPSSAKAIVIVVLFAFAILVAIFFHSLINAPVRLFNRIKKSLVSLLAPSSRPALRKRINPIITPYQALKVQALFSCGTVQVAKFPPQILFRHLFREYQSRKCSSINRIATFAARPSPLRRVFPAQEFPLCPRLEMPHKDITKWMSTVRVHEGCLRPSSSCNTSTPTKHPKTVPRPPRTTQMSAISPPPGPVGIVSQPSLPSYYKGWGAVVHSFAKPKRQNKENIEL